MSMSIPELVILVVALVFGVLAYCSRQPREAALSMISSFAAFAFALIYSLRILLLRIHKEQLDGLYTMFKPMLKVYSAAFVVLMILYVMAMLKRIPPTEPEVMNELPKTK